MLTLSNIGSVRGDGLEPIRSVLSGGPRRPRARSCLVGSVAAIGAT